LKSTLVLKAIRFAACYHNGQTRADGTTPYISHPVRVMTIISTVFGVNDPKILATAVLHDVIEDTEANYDKILKEFGVEVADNVALLSKDMRLPKTTREKVFLDGLEGANPSVQICKLADMLDNLIDTDTINQKKIDSIVNKAKSILKMLDAVAKSVPDPLTTAVKEVKIALKNIE